jgi:aldehyde dehydrogenase (NAD+)
VGRLGFQPLGLEPPPLGWIGVPFRARGKEEALAIANDTEHGLSSCVFTRDAERGVRFAQRVQAGMTHVNGLPSNPFAGEENSGIGRSNGKWGVEAFTADHRITVQHVPRLYPADATPITGP